MNHRIISIEILRIIACFFVIMFHCDYIVKPNFNQTIYGFGAYFIYHISTIGLPVFFIVASLSFLNENDYASDIWNYYKRKLINPGIPFYLMSMFYSFWSHLEEIKAGHFAKTIWKIFVVSLKEPQHYHLWFIYSWMGLTILFPFLKRLLNHLSYGELKCFVFICIIVKTLTNYSLMLINEFYFGSWVIYCILGYYLLMKETKRNYHFFYLFGILSFIAGLLIDFMGYRDTVLGNHLFDTSPIMIFQIAALFCFFIDLSNYIDKYIPLMVEKTIQKLSSCTVWIYLWHPFFLTKYGNIFIGGGKANYAIEILSVATAVFLISVLVSLLCDWMQKNIKNMIHDIKINEVSQ